MRSSKNLWIALAIATTASASTVSSAKAVELAFATNAYVGGTSRLDNLPNGRFHRLSNGYYYDSYLSRVANKGVSYTTLRYNGAAHVKNLEFSTFADPARVRNNALADMRTSTRGNAELDHITVYVKPISGEVVGRPVVVTITVNRQCSLSASDGKSSNYTKFYLNDSPKFAHTEKRRGSFSTRYTYTVKTKIGHSFTIAMQGISNATKTCSAQQTVQVEMSAPVRVR